MLRPAFLPALVATFATFLFGPDAEACGRRHACYCVPVCCPAPCYPWFSFRAYLTKDSPYIPPDPQYKLPLEVAVTNWEPYEWAYYNSEYGYYLFDEWGNWVPDVFILPTVLRRIDVPPRVTKLDQPEVYLRADRLRLGRPYTVVVTLRCHCSSFVVIPFLERRDKKETEAAASPAPATLVVTLPPDATLTVDDHATTSTSGTRTLVTPDLPPGKEFSYILKAEFLRDGKRQTVTRRVIVRAGEETRVGLDVHGADGAAE
jgi:uncharacterized protein (TIGR03000 family)